MADGTGLLNLTRLSGSWVRIPPPPPGGVAKAKERAIPPPTLGPPSVVAGTQ